MYILLFFDIIIIGDNMRIGNKGFAISTILYGILSLTILILLLTFGIMKANKDMNDDLVDGIELKLNRCINEEVNLESCYYAGGNCDPEIYNTCIGKTGDLPLLADVASVGDYVDYNAGNWNEERPLPNINSGYSFGGYKKADSRNASVSCNGNNAKLNYGWKVFAINGNVVTLIHAGTPECFTFENEAKAYYVLTGIKSSALDASGLSVKSWNDYVDTTYATKGATPSLPTAASNEFFENDKVYILGDLYSTHITFIEGNTIKYGPANNIVYGIKPIVVLKSTVRTSGSINNADQNGKTWILSQDGE